MIDSQVFKEPKMVMGLGWGCVRSFLDRVCGAEEDQQGGVSGGGKEGQAFRVTSRKDRREVGGRGVGYGAGQGRGCAGPVLGFLLA